ncbi:MAG TPA: hypothetical protein VFQ85_07870 [Mycobacteriales bacterium]|jgi:hypothetical protein|nr:hypothetical protein [Mycobacteriales bacterium]
MTFPERVVAALRPEIDRRTRGPLYYVTSVLFAAIPRDRWTPTRRKDPVAVERAVAAAAAAFTEGERAAFERDGTLPAGFWEKVLR